MSANVVAQGASLGLEAYAGPSIDVEAAFANACQFPAGGSVFEEPGGSMSVEAAFANFAPAGGSIGFLGPGPSIGVEAAFANAFPGFDGASVFVEAAFADPGPRRASGCSAMVGAYGASMGVAAAGASMTVEGAFSEFAPPFEAGSSVVTGAAPSQPSQPSRPAQPSQPAQASNALAAMYAAAEARAQASAAPALTFGEDSGLRQPQVGTPRRRPLGQPPPSVMPPRRQLGAQTAPPPRRPLQRQPPQAEPVFAQPVIGSSILDRPPPSEVVRRRPNAGSYRGTVQSSLPHYNVPVAQLAFEALEARDGAPLASEVAAYPYMYHAPDLRYEAAPTVAYAVPAQQDASVTLAFNAQQFSSLDGPQYSYPGIQSVTRDMPSYVPRALSSRYEQQLTPSPTPTQGLSLKQVAAGPGIPYPGPAPQRGSPSYTTPYAVPVQAVPAGSTPTVPQHAATSPAPVAAPVRNAQPNPQTQMVQLANGYAGLYGQQPQPAAATQPVLEATAAPIAVATPTSLAQSMSRNFIQMPTASYTRPSHIPSQMPSFTAPATASQPQAPTYAFPQVQQVLSGYAIPGGMQLSNGQNFAVQISGVREASGAAGASLIAPSREGGIMQVLVHPPARGYA